MTRAEVLKAITTQLGRPLTIKESAFVEATLDSRRSTNLSMADVTMVVRDLNAGAADAPVPDTPSGQPGQDPSEFVPQNPAAHGMALQNFDQASPPDALGPLRQQAYEAGEGAGATPQEVDEFIAKAVADAESAREWEASGQILPPFASTDPTVLIEQQIAAWEEEAAALLGAPIGVPEGFIAQRETDISPHVGFTGVPGVQEVEPRYFDGDQFSPAGMSAERIAQIQKRLVKAGLIGEDAYYAGFWDSQTAQAYTSVLGWANQRGTDADEALEDLIKNVPDSVKEARNAEKLARQFQAPAFVKPDYATLAQDTKQYMRSRLGRKPTDDEMAELTGAMSGAYRADYEAEVAAMRSEFEAEQQGLETGVAQTPNSVTDVDPLARFREQFERKFGDEIAYRESLPEVRNNMENVFASLRTMGSLVDG